MWRAGSARTSWRNVANVTVSGCLRVSAEAVTRRAGRATTAAKAIVSARRHHEGRVRSRIVSAAIAAMINANGRTGTSSRIEMGSGVYAEYWLEPDQYRRIIVAVAAAQIASRPRASPNPAATRDSVSPNIL